MTAFHPAQEKPLEDRRKFSRLHTMLNAQFFLEPQMGWQECLIFNISCNGLAIQFHKKETLTVGLPIYLEACNAFGLEVIHFRGVVRWTGKMNNSYIAGIEVHNELDEETLAKLL